MPSTHTYTLSLHDALPISAPVRRSEPSSRSSRCSSRGGASSPTSSSCRSSPSPPSRGCRSGTSSWSGRAGSARSRSSRRRGARDRKSTRLNSSHTVISYAVHPHLHSFPTRRSSDLRTSPEIGAVLAVIPLFFAWRSLFSYFFLLPLFAFAAVARMPLGDLVVERARRFGALTIFAAPRRSRSEEHTSELQSHSDLVCRPPTPTLFPYTTLFRSPHQSGDRSRPRGHPAVLRVAEPLLLLLPPAALRLRRRRADAARGPRRGAGAPVRRAHDLRGAAALEIGRAHV